MKRIRIVLIWSALILIATGCGSKKSSEAEKSVTDVSNSSVEETAKEEEVKEEEDTSAQAGEEVDYDLTVMSSEMVFALVYQMMVNPETYNGKTVRMDGLYSYSYGEKTKQYYSYCIIQDATACCAQGMEFVWEDGSHVYPQEYPEENAQIIVQGVFETYEEEGRTYCRLKDASLEVRNET